MLLTVVACTLGLSLLAVRWLAPGLLGAPASLQLVRIDERTPPFFENVFRTDDKADADQLLKDPLTLVRARPLLPRSLRMGPHDLLGFRNVSIPA